MTTPSDALGRRARLESEIAGAILDEYVASSYGEREAQAEATARLRRLLDRMPLREV